MCFVGDAMRDPLRRLKTPAGQQWMKAFVVFSLVAAFLATLAWAVSFELQRSESTPWAGYAAIAIIAPGPNRVQVDVPFSMGGQSDTVVQVVDVESEYWFRDLARLFPRRTPTYMDLKFGSESLTMITNGTFVVGVEWRPRSADDALPFAPANERPEVLRLTVSGALQGVRILILGWTPRGGFLTNEESTYAITTDDGVGPSGFYNGDVHGGELLIEYADPVPLEASGGVELLWGTFSTPGLD